MADEQKLDSFLPSIETLEHVRHNLVNAGIDSSAIPKDWLSAICAAFVKHISQSKEGHSYISGLLNFHWQPGPNTKEFILLDEHGRECGFAKPEEISIFSGCIVKGVPTHPSRVRIKDREEYKCDDCGVRAHCVTEVLNYNKDRIDSLCNTCLNLSTEPKQRDMYRDGLCETCDDLICPHHPKREEHELENSPWKHRSISGRIR